MRAQGLCWGMALSEADPHRFSFHPEIHARPHCIHPISRDSSKESLSRWLPRKCLIKMESFLTNFLSLSIAVSSFFFISSSLSFYLFITLFFISSFSFLYFSLPLFLFSSLLFFLSCYSALTIPGEPCHA